MEPTARLRRDERRWSPLQPRALLSSFLASIGSVVVGALFTLLLLKLAISGFANYSGENIAVGSVVVFSVSVMTASLAAAHHLLFGLPISLLLWMTGNFTPAKTAVCGLFVGGLPFSMISLASGSHHASELFPAIPLSLLGALGGAVFCLTYRRRIGVDGKERRPRELGTLIAAIDFAMKRPNDTPIATRLQHVLENWMDSAGARLPRGLDMPHPDHYARRELYRSPDHGYTLVAMTWGPGQGTPLHDHDGQWCVEGVKQGTLTITQYDRIDQPDRILFNEAGLIVAGPGMAGNLIPPHEYHTIQNKTADVAISLHIYEGEMTHCSAFVPDWKGGYRKVDKILGTDGLPNTA